MIFNYAVGGVLSDNQKGLKIEKKHILKFGIGANIILLVYFKYVDFFIENINHMGGGIALLNIALPLAISFFTFQQIAYLVDSYKQETSEYDFLSYALFVTFFPQLIAGPIVHHKEMMPQFSSKWNLVKKYNNISVGIFIFSIGLFKKVIIADSFSIFVAKGFDDSLFLNFFDAWAVSLSYTLQLYFDFSGYTDMAIGAALLFNIKLPINFNSPYKAKNIQDFWRRWHITLSNFLRDYVYIPLGGSRNGNFSTYNNLMLTFVLGGLWHGAGWTFVFWGALHGLALVIHRMWSRLGLVMNPVLSWFITFNFLNIAWVFFRAKDIGDAIKILKGMAGYNGFNVTNQFSKSFEYFTSINISNLVNANYSFVLDISMLWYFLAGFLILSLKNTIELKQCFTPNYKSLVICCFLLVFSLSSILYQQNRVSEFLYFDF